jgi:hypothetical protein
MERTKKPAPRPAHFVVRENGGWTVRSVAGAAEVLAARVYPTKAQAVRAAQDAVQDKGGEVVVRGRDGRIRGSYTIGRDPFGQIGAVEGIKPTQHANARAAEFDRKGLSPEQRRREIIKAHRPKG